MLIFRVIEAGNVHPHVAGNGHNTGRPGLRIHGDEHHTVGSGNLAGFGIIVIQSQQQYSHPAGAIPWLRLSDQWMAAMNRRLAGTFLQSPALAGRFHLCWVHQEGFPDVQLETRLRMKTNARMAATIATTPIPIRMIVLVLFFCFFDLLFCVLAIKVSRINVRDKDTKLLCNVARDVPVQDAKVFELIKVCIQYSMKLAGEAQAGL